MQLHHQSTKILLLGKTGSGKSVYQYRFIMAARELYDRFFIFDHKREFQQRMGIIPHTREEKLVEAIIRGDRYILYNHEEEFPGDSDLAFQYFSEWTFEMAKATQVRSLFVTDEVNRFTTSSEMGWEFRQLIEDGRLQGLDFIGTAHSANAVSNKLRLQLSEIVALKTTDARALEFLEDNGFDPAEVRELEIGQFICYVESTGEFIRDRLFYPQNRGQQIAQEASKNNTLQEPKEDVSSPEKQPSPPSPPSQ